MTTIELLCGVAALLSQLSLGFALAFAIPFGLGYGGAFVSVQLLVAECFGFKYLGRILGVTPSSKRLATRSAIT